MLPFASMAAFSILMFIFFGVVELGVAVGLFFHARGLERKRSRVINTPWSAIGRLDAGLAKVKGRILGVGPLLSSPITKTPCVYYRFRVEETGENGWVTIIDDKQGTDLAVSDDTGRCRVNLLGAEVFGAAHAHAQFQTLGEAPAELKATLERYKATKGISLPYGPWRCTETVLKEGDRVSVMGTAVPGGEGFEIVRRSDGLIVSASDESHALGSIEHSSLAWTLVATLLGVMGFIFVVVGLAKSFVELRR